jgi:hypothetical protein
MLAKNGTYSQEPSFAPGSYNWSTIIHETGHALGLKHPGNYNAGGVVARHRFYLQISIISSTR